MSPDLIEFIVQGVFVGVGAIAFIVTFIRTGNIKKSLGEFMKYFNFDKNTKQSTSYSQKFSEYKDSYILNPSTNELEKLDTPKNIQAEIDSYLDCALERALEKFLPSDVVDDKNIADYTQRVDDLSVIGEAIDIAEDYRVKYNLPDSYTPAQIYDFISKQASDIKSKLSDSGKEKISEVKSDVEA